MRSFVTIIGLCLACLSGLAHNAKISTFTLRDTGGGWIIEMAFSQATVDVAMLRIFGNDVSKLRREEYRDAVVAYVRENFSLIVDGEEVPLEVGGIMLGSHQTDLKFILPSISQTPKAMSIHIPMFGYEFNHTNILRMYRGGNKSTKFFLSEDNDFRTSVELSRQGIVEVKAPQQARSLTSGSLSIVGILAIIMAISLVWNLKNRREQESRIKKT